MIYTLVQFNKKSHIQNICWLDINKNLLNLFFSLKLFNAKKLAEGFMFEVKAIDIGKLQAVKLVVDETENGL